jgi:opacity protein-like surface antigen
MKKIMLLIVFASIALPSFSLTFLEYFAHINIAFGPSLLLGGDVSGDSDNYEVILYHSGGGTLRFPYKPSDIEKWPVGINFTIRLPVYYNETLSTGITFDADIAGSVFSGFAGGYFEYYLNNKLSFLGGLGFSMANVSTDIGKIPGGYSDSGDTVSVTGFSASGIGFSAGVKYHFFKYFFLEAGYHFGWKHTIDDYTVQIDGEDIETTGAAIEPLYINYKHAFAVKIGFGI